MAKELNKIKDAPIYFLGICDKYLDSVIGRAGNYEFIGTDLIGLRHIYISNIFPFPAQNFFVVLLFDNNFADGLDTKVLLKKKDTGESVGSIAIQGGLQGDGNIFPSRFTILGVLPQGVYSEPGVYQLTMETGGEERNIGEFRTEYVPALPLTKERIEALKSDPNAAKYIKIELKCNKCNSSIQALAGIEKKEKDLEDGSVWYEDLPDEFICSCGQTKRTLKYWRESLHALLGYKPSPFNINEEIERNYTRSALAKVVTDFKSIIEKTEKEEEVQKFIESNPLVLSIFSPQLLKFKAAATAHYKTDFALLNQKGELLLIEIEKPSTPLYKKNGDPHSQLTHAINQAENWLQEARRNKLGLIDDLGIKGLKIDMVSHIKAVVIAGKSLPEYERHIGKLRSRTDIDFYTYDDLYEFLRHITRKILDI